MSFPKPYLFFLSLLSIAALQAGVAATPSYAVSSQTEIVCGDEEEPEPEVDADGILVEPDASTEEDRAGDYDDSAEDVDMGDDEGAEMTAEEKAGFAKCLGTAADAAADVVVDAMKSRWNGVSPLSLGRFGADELPYGGTVKFILQNKQEGTIGRAKLKLRSGDSKALKLRLNAKGRKLLRTKGRLPATGKLTVTDALSGLSATEKSKVTLKYKP